MNSTTALKVGKEVKSVKFLIDQKKKKNQPFIHPFSLPFRQSKAIDSPQDENDRFQNILFLPSFPHLLPVSIKGAKEEKPLKLESLNFNFKK